MVDELEKSAIKLAQSEREEASRNGETSGARNQESAYANALNGKVFSENLTQQIPM
jgi:hypothetical protein